MTICRAFASVLATIILALTVSTAHAAPCTLVKTAAQLQAMNNNLAGNYCLANDIDMSSTANFTPIGTQASPFTGLFDGQNHVISNLKIDSTAVDVGLFGAPQHANFRNVTIANANVTARSGMSPSVGILVSDMMANGPDVVVSHVKVGGKVTCTADCYIGGLAGQLETGVTITHSSSSAAVSAPANTLYIGGLVGVVHVGAAVTRSYATGAVTCGGDACYAGGLAGANNGAVSFSFAVGPVSSQGPTFNLAAGLIAQDINSGGAPTRQSFALGPVFVSGDSSGAAGGLTGSAVASTVDQCYAAGPVGAQGGAVAGGLIGEQPVASTVSNSYWDTQTSGQSTSVGGTGAPTRYLTNKLPAGFGSDWSITPGRSFPFLTDPQIDFNAPLATLVHGNTLFTFLPIGQLDKWNYIGNPAHTDQASLATVYTMIARAVSISDDVASLSNVKINKYFWHDRTEKTTYTGPVTAHATLGTLATIPGATPINRFNVLGQMNAGRPVILRGTYKTGKTTTATHYMLGTLYTTDANGAPKQLVADDPYTGEQVRIDLVKKTVVAPARFPLAHFTVDGYQPVTLN